MLNEKSHSEKLNTVYSHLFNILEITKYIILSLSKDLLNVYKQPNWSINIVKIILGKMIIIIGHL